MRALLALKQSNTEKIEELILSAFSPGDDVVCVSDQQGLLSTIISKPPDILLYNRFFPGDMPVQEALRAVKHSSPRTRIIFVVGQLNEKAWADCAAARLMGIKDIVCWEKGIALNGSQLLGTVQKMIISPRSDIDNDGLDRMLESVMGVRIRKPRVYVYGRINRNLPSDVDLVDLPNDADLIIAAGDPEEAVRFFSSLDCTVPVVMVSDFDDAEVKSLVKSNVAAIRPEMLDDFLKDFFFPGDGSAPTSSPPLVKEAVQTAKTGGNIKTKFLGLLKKWGGWKLRSGKNHVASDKVTPSSRLFLSGFGKRKPDNKLDDPVGSGREFSVKEESISSWALPNNLTRKKEKTSDSIREEESVEEIPGKRVMTSDNVHRKIISDDSLALPDGFIALGSVNGVSSSVDTVKEVIANKPRVVLVSGTRWIKDLRREKSLAAVPIIVVGDEDPSICCLAGADECVSVLDPPAIDLILARVTRMREMWAQAETDGLTGCYTRRFLDAYLAREQRSFVALLCDLDHFKKVNDTYGHPAGDEVLRRFGRFLRDSVRQTDIVARYGGEEFLILFYVDTDESVFFTRILATVRDMSVRWAAENMDISPDISIRITFSGGMSMFARDGATPVEVVSVADRRLYAAKAAGRNQVVADDTKVSNQPNENSLLFTEKERPAFPREHQTKEQGLPKIGHMSNNLFRTHSMLFTVETVVPELDGIVAVWNVDNYKKAETCVELAAILGSRMSVALCEFDFTNPAMDDIFHISKPLQTKSVEPGKLGAGLLTIGNELKAEHAPKLFRKIKLRNVFYLPAGNDLGVKETSRRYAGVSVYRGIIDLARSEYDIVVLDVEIGKDMPTTKAALSMADIVIIPVSGEKAVSKYDQTKEVFRKIFFVTA